MKEDLRLEMLRRIKEEKRKVSGAKGKISRLKELEENDVVKEYLKLRKEIEDASVLSDNVILANEKERIFYTDDCCHDVCLFTQYSMAFKHGFYTMAKIEDSLLNMYATHAEFFCLDCASYILVPLSEVEDFKSSHKVINSDVPFSTVTLNRECWKLKDFRNHYFELLLNYSSEEAYNIMKQEYSDNGLLSRKK